MEFNSIEFLNIFFPLCLIIVSIYPKLAGYILLIFSSIFYAWNSSIGFFLLVSSVLIVHLGRSKLYGNFYGKLLIAFLLILPFVFFRSSSNLIKLFPLLSELNTNYPESLILPAGVSFYTFQLIGYLFDQEPKYQNIKLRESLLFTLFFPQLIAGPIERAEDLIPQIKNIFKNGVFFDSINCKKGIYLISLGLFFKTIFGDVIGAEFLADFYKGGTFAAFTHIICNGSVIYFDFLGYSLIAIGLAKFFNINLTLNFMRPYASISVGEFWRRWHITLTRWFKDYIYKPLASNFNFSKLSLTFLTLIVFLLTALWHGFGLRFLIWGFGHFIFVVISRIITPYCNNPIQRYLSWFMCFLIINFLWLFFFYDLPKCFDIIQNLFTYKPLENIVFAKKVLIFAPFSIVSSLLIEPSIIVNYPEIIDNQSKDEKLVVFSFLAKKITSTLLRISYNYFFISFFLLFSIAFFSYSSTFIYFRF